MNPTIFKGDAVTVHVSDSRLEEMRLIDPESSYYVEKFLGQSGQVFDITLNDSGQKSYHVNFGNEIGIFYRNEVTVSK